MRVRTHTPLWRRLIRKSGRKLFDFADNNGESDISRNGELWLIGSLLASHLASGSVQPFTVIDAGANTGDYTAVVLRESHRYGCAVTVHALEPSARSAARLVARFAGDARVRVVRAAVGDRTGNALLYGGESGSTQASLISREVLAGAEATEVPMLRLEDFLVEREIAFVHLLKLDVEGFELAALEGLGSRLHPGSVDVIQFEYGGTTLEARASLRDFYHRLSAAGYSIAKLFPNAAEVRSYDPGMDHYAYSNFLALSPRWRAGRGPRIEGR
jgi:FkbM family methyltransferase